MDNKESKRVIELIKKSREEIGDNYDELAKKVDSDLKEMLNEKQYKVWIAANGTLEEEKELISQIGEKEYSKILNEVIKILSQEKK